MFIAGWSSPVARWAHNPKVAGSNPVPATNLLGDVAQLGEHLICIQGVAGSTPVISTSFLATRIPIFFILVRSAKTDQPMSEIKPSFREGFIFDDGRMQ